MRETPLLYDPHLSDEVGREVYLKAECLQVTGSFKVRGAAARISALTDAEAARGVVACSSGNHGRATAWVCQQAGVPATIYVPTWVDPVKLEGIETAGATVRASGGTFDESEAAAIEDADRTERVYISAYDDPWVIAGQGTIADEVVAALGAPPAAMVVPLSGGGLVGGIASVLRVRHGAQEATRIVAASASRASVMMQSVGAGRPIEVAEEPTLANALAGGIGLNNRYSFDLVRDVVDDHVEVSEAEIARAMRYGVERVRVVVEGGGAVGLAALLSGVWHPTTALSDGPVVVVLSGGNVGRDSLLEVLGSKGVKGSADLSGPE